MADKKSKNSICGIVMPISAIDGCSEGHWVEVLEILTESIEASGFEANLVSNADDIGIIQKRIIQNLYENPVAVCDVSGKNPNVMFELGMRLAFDRPTIIVKDDKTTYSFDTAPIEHLEYPRDLRFKRIIDFKSKLTEKISKTHEAASADPSYTTFLKHFGEFKVAKLDTKEVTSTEYLIDEIRSLRNAIARLSKPTAPYDMYKRVRELDENLVVVQFEPDDSVDLPLNEFVMELQKAGVDVGNISIRHDKGPSGSMQMSFPYNVDLKLIQDTYDKFKERYKVKKKNSTTKRSSGLS